MKTTAIKIGDLVRSYDFPGVPCMKGMRTTCYVEGIVEAIGPVAGVGGCDRYTIRITRRVWKGRDDDAWKSDKEFPGGRAYPPVNGVPSLFGGVTRGVMKIETKSPTKTPNVKE